MARHRTQREKVELGERAQALRAAGRSRREIQAEPGIGEELCGQLLRGVPLPDSLGRPRAKDEVREAAVDLRQAGKTYDQISAELGVSKSTCSLWLRDLPHPEDDPGHAAAAKERRVEALRARARRGRDARDEEGRQVSASVANALGPITSRDLVLALAVSYWCEGAKRKPWNRRELVCWVNSDPMLVSLFLEGLDAIGVRRDQLSLRLQIHETADEETARHWWADHTGVPLEQFSRSTIKRHRPLTRRQNVGAEYRGCLTVKVRRSRTLYLVLEGVMQGLARRPRGIEGWHDGAEVPPDLQSDGGAPSALV